ncbi:MAG: WYL domain-containing protein [Muribaculaceae bacterium]|nr:WYL domain-containing protein [Muribaculaceae bacterium]
MKQNLSRLVRYMLIINKLSGRQKYVPANELFTYIDSQMMARGFDSGMTIRTLQRDINDIEQVFGIVIKNYRGYGYYIADNYEDTELRYKELLMNFDLLTAVSRDTNSEGYIIPEHHQPKGSDQIPTLIKAIKENSVITFTYTLFRQDNKEINKRVKPYFLKESLGLWYLIAKDKKERIKSYGIDRISDLEITDETFKKDESVNPNEFYKYSYGIWDDPETLVEEVELKYDALDESFLKSNPLHWTQEILADNEDEFRIRLNIKITNDFVMALLARTRSLTVIKPESLKDRIKNLYIEALNRYQ